MALTDRGIAITGVIVAVIFGLLAIVAAYYFYERSIQERIPTFLLSPVRTNIVNPGNVTGLSILYKGKAVEQTNVVSLRIYFWNQGGLAIRKADILRPIEIVLPKDSEILDDRILKANRVDITNIGISISESRKNVLDINFSILEKNDGAAIQIIYAGSPDANIEFVGTVVGAQSPTVSKGYGSINEVPFLTAVARMPFWMWLIFGVMLALAIFVLFGRRLMILMFGQKATEYSGFVVPVLFILFPILVIYAQAHIPLSDVPDQIVVNVQ